jgi:hypothetical protein
MKLMATNNRQAPLITATGHKCSPYRLKNLRAELRARGIAAQALQKYGAALEIYQTGGVGLREIEESLIKCLKAEATSAALALERVPRADASEGSLPEAVFRRNGEYWTIGFPEQESCIKDRKGLRYLADLLRSPGNRIPALELITQGRNSQDADDYLVLSDDAGPMLDYQAKAAYERRLVELREERDAAEDRGDEPRALKVETEMEAIRRELSRAFTLNGRQRHACKLSERARLNVTRSIRLAVVRVAGFNPYLGRHLQASIKTGSFCCYLPHPMYPISWRL